MKEAIFEAIDGQMVESYFKMYRPHMEVLEKSLLNRAVGVTDHHLIQLGKQLDAYRNYEKLLENSGSLNTLGELPKVALDVITATFANSILGVIATTQTIDQQKQIVYFKNLRSDSTKGNLTAGQTIVDPRSPMVTPSAFASNEVASEVLVATAAATLVYNGTCAILPVRSQFIYISVQDDVTVYCEDVGPRGSDKNIGSLLGAGLSGTINYTTGAVALRFAVQPAQPKSVFIKYQQNLELASDLPKMNSFLDHVTIEAKAYALKSVMGIFQSFALKKQLGDSAVDDMAMDLVREINAEIGGDFIRQYDAQAVGNTNFSLTAPVNVAEKLHRESYAFRMADAEAVMIGNAGRGAIKVMIVGTEHAALVRGLDGFQLLSDGNSLGAHIFGTYKSITYIRVPEASLLAAKAGIALYTGASPLESAGVYSPFMPLTMVQAPANSLNPLMDQRVAATMAGTKVVVPAYATKLTITA